MIAHLNKKASPYTLYDSHSGAGMYSLTDERALKNREFETGISRVVNADADQYPVLSTYLKVCQAHLERHCYPGSPVFSRALKRDIDTLHLFELDNGESSLLAQMIQGCPAATVHKRDGFDGVKAFTPPSNQRGAVIIDPPYEQKSEYDSVIRLVTHILKCWRLAPILIWYPKLSIRTGDKYQLSERMTEQVARLGKPTWISELCIHHNSEDVGMYGTGVCIVNPPWGIDRQIDDAMGLLLPAFGESASYQSRWLVESQ